MKRLKILLFILYLLIPSWSYSQISGSFKDARDEIEYKWVRIGNQYWMADNLGYIEFDNVSAPLPSENPAYYLYGFNSVAKDLAIAQDTYINYGILYNWSAAETACPNNWHLPNTDEWGTLENYINSQNNDSKVGWYLKSKNLWSDDGGGIDKYFFSARPGGCFFTINGSFEHINTTGYWWSYRESLNNPTGLAMRNVSENIEEIFFGESFGFSIRCVLNEDAFLPGVVTDTVIKSSLDSVELKGILSNSNDGSITSQGFFLGNSKDYLFDDLNVITNESISDNFSVSIKNLYQSVRYYYCAFATSDNITSYGDIKSFALNLMGTFSDQRDNKEYKWVKIGNQFWMAENLAYLPEIKMIFDYHPDSSAYYVYDYQGANVTEAKLTSNYKNYGVLYNWKAASESCPEGWYLPSNDDWDELKNTIEQFYDTSDFGKILKSHYGWDDNMNGDNSLEFTGLPGGEFIDEGVFYRLGWQATWWSSSQSINNPDRFDSRAVANWSSDLIKDDFGKGYGFSVRCLASDETREKLLDSDNDGVSNAEDNCPEIANPGQEDMDSDGVGDVCDDSDDDGIVDSEDNCPEIANPDQEDMDSDGVGDVCDDTDSDGIMDNEDNCPEMVNPDQLDTDADGLGDFCDNDLDGDGILNDEDNCPYIANSDQNDIDEDGLGDACDEDIDGDDIPNEIDNCEEIINPDQSDLDGDGIGDACDNDLDGDGIVNDIDNCPETPNKDQKDLDGDGIGDVCDDDIDGDGIVNDIDNCPEIENPEQEDLDGDGEGDSCDNDWDGDKKPNNRDNCPMVYNPKQEDLDEDGEGDACDDDIDGDGIINDEDNCKLIVNYSQSDLDNDGEGDACDDDIDGDGIFNSEDNCPYTFNPDQLDTNNDGTGDVCDLFIMDEISSAGGNLSETDASISYTVGQIVYTFISNQQSGNATQGIQQPYIFMSTYEDEVIKKQGVEFLVYPNPTIGKLTLEVNGMQNVQLEWVITDIHGRILLKGKATEKITVISIDKIVSSSFIFSFLDGERILKTFNIIKN